MRKFVMIVAASGLLSAPGLAYGDDKTSPTKAEREAAEEREAQRKCKEKRETPTTKSKCKVTVPTRGETPSRGPIGRAYNAPFF